MVALPVAPSCLKIRLIGTTQGANVVNVLHAQFAGGTLAAADCVAIATGIRNAFFTNFASLLNNTTTYNTFEVTDLGSNTGATGVNTTAVTGTASAGGTVMTSACCVLSWKTNLHFRGGHARTYLPLRSATDVTVGRTLATTYQSSMSSAASSFLTACNAVTSGSISIALAMVSYFSHHAMRPTGTPFLITGAVVHSRADTQRRRLGKETS